MLAVTLREPPLLFRKNKSRLCSKTCGIDNIFQLKRTYHKLFIILRDFTLTNCVNKWERSHPEEDLKVCSPPQTQQQLSPFYDLSASPQVKMKTLAPCMDLLSCSISAGESLRRVVRTGTRRSFSSSPGRVTNWKEKQISFEGESDIFWIPSPTPKGGGKCSFVCFSRGLGKRPPGHPFYVAEYVSGTRFAKKNRCMLWEEGDHSEFWANFFPYFLWRSLYEPFCALKILTKEKKEKKG